MADAVGWRPILVDGVINGPAILIVTVYYTGRYLCGKDDRKAARHDNRGAEIDIAQQE